MDLQMRDYSLPRLGKAKKFFINHVDLETDECIIWPYSDAWKISIKSCERHHGSRPGPEYEACHGPCHNQLCFNPKHLSWQTTKQNALDRHRDKTMTQAKLSIENVNQIRELYPKYNQYELAEMFNISQTQVWKILNRLRWKWVENSSLKGKDLFS
jgi:hypothetical protein